MIKIRIHTPVYSQILVGKELLKDLLSYKTVYYQQAQYRKVRRESRKLVFDHKSGVFYTGLVDKIVKYAEDNSIDVVIEESREQKEIVNSVKFDKSKELKGIELRADQNRLVNSALEKKRGVIVSPTGSGKTVVALSIMKKFENQKMLFLCPNLTILKQTVSELKRFNFKDVCVMSEGEKKLHGKIVVSNMQTFVRLNLNAVLDYFSIVIVDEAHLAFGSSGTYEKILSKLVAPVRLGFTATLPTETEKLFMLDGLIGPVIDSVSFEEGQEMKFLAEPKIKLVTVPYCSSIMELKTYRDIYQKAIVEYDARNKIIIKEALKLIDEHNTVMIFITKLEHGERLYDIAKSYDINVEFVRGEVDSKTKQSNKKLLLQKEHILHDKAIMNRQKTTPLPHFRIAGLDGA
jgi:superfamily II DNA or RNA helicase